MQQLADVLAKPGFQKAAANAGWLFAERGMRFLLGTVVGFLVARYLGPERLGLLSYCTALVTLAGCATSLGLDAVVKRDLLQARDAAGELLAGGAVLRFTVALAGYGILLGLIAGGLAEGREEPRLLAMLGLVLFQPALLMPDLWLQANLQAKYSVWAQTGALAVGALLRLMLIGLNAPLAAFACVFVVEAALAAAGLQILARRAGLRFAWAEARRASMTRLVREAWPLVFAGPIRRVRTLRARSAVSAPVRALRAVCEVSCAWSRASAITNRTMFHVPG